MNTDLKFPQFVGQELVQRALLINLVSPLVGGLLITGKSGTGKSSLINSLKDILPHIKQHLIPNSINFDMLLGTLDIETSLAKGILTYKKGLLGNSTGDLLILDNAQLCPRTIIKEILNIQRKQYYSLEREGFSAVIPTNYHFIALYTRENNQPFDFPIQNFSMYVETTELKAIKQRVKFLQELFSTKSYSIELENLKNQLLNARAKYKLVTISEQLLLLAAKYCQELNCMGNDTEINLISVAKSIAALENRLYVLPRDLEEACTYVLPHQSKQNTHQGNKGNNKPADHQNNSSDLTNEHKDNISQTIDDSFDNNLLPEKANNSSEPKNQQITSESLDSDLPTSDNQPLQSSNQQEDKIATIDNNVLLPKIQLINTLKKNSQKLNTGKRKGLFIKSVKGIYSGYSFPKGKIKNLAFLPTIKAAAPYQQSRGKKALAINVQPMDYREKVFTKQIGNLFVFLVDASGSMGARKRMEVVKGTILQMLKDAYINRDAITFIAFRNTSAEILLPITNSIELGNKKLMELPTGGRTPLHEGLATAYQVINNVKEKYNPVLILITDGKVNGLNNGQLSPWEQAKSWSVKISELSIPSLVIDTNKDFLKLHFAEEIANLMGAKYLSLQDLTQIKLLTLARNTAGTE